MFCMRIKYNKYFGKKIGKISICQRSCFSFPLSQRNRRKNDETDKKVNKKSEKKRNVLIYILRTEEERNPARSLTLCSFDSTLEFIHVDIAY